MKNILLDYFGWPEVLLLLTGLVLLNTGLYNILRGSDDVTILTTAAASAAFVMYASIGEYFKSKASNPPYFRLLYSVYATLLFSSFLSL